MSVSQAEFVAYKAETADRLKKVEDHIASLNAMKYRTQLRPAGYKYMSEESKAAYDAFKQGGHPDVYKEGDKIWRKNFATKEQQIEATKLNLFETSCVIYVVPKNEHATCL